MAELRHDHLGSGSPPETPSVRERLQAPYLAAVNEQYPLLIADLITPPAGNAIAHPGACAPTRRASRSAAPTTHVALLLAKRGIASMAALYPPKAPAGNKGSN